MVSLLVSGHAFAQDDLALETYKCSEFLSDSAQPNTPQKLIRSLATVAWATGFASAHQLSNARADSSAMRLIAIMAGEACRKAPKKAVFDAITQDISAFVSAHKKK
jgi:hypothetical protein